LSTLIKPGCFNEDSFAAFLASSEESVKLNLNVEEFYSSPDVFPLAFSETSTIFVPNEVAKKD
jgi:hypothetical protein